MTTDKEMREAFEAWKEGNERWQSASPLIAFQAAYQLQQKRIDDFYIKKLRQAKQLHVDESAEIQQLQTHLSLAVSALNQLERILTYDDNYNGTDMQAVIRTALKQIKGNQP